MWLARLKNAVLMSYHPMNVQLFEVFLCVDLMILVQLQFYLLFYLFMIESF